MKVCVVKCNSDHHHPSLKTKRVIKSEIRAVVKIIELIKV